MVNITHTKEDAAVPIPAWIFGGQHLEAAKALYFADATATTSWDGLTDDERSEYHVRVVRALDPDYKPPVAEGALSTDEDPRLVTDEPLVVTCTVDIPLSSPHATADALSRVPADASIRHNTPQGTLTIRWQEER